MRQTIEESIMASLRRRVAVDELADEQARQFEGLMRDGDELWWFRTPQETWTSFTPRCGMEGYAMVRDGKVVAEIFTSIS